MKRHHPLVAAQNQGSSENERPNQESPFISEIKLRLSKIDVLRNQIEQHYLSGNVDPAFIETLNTENVVFKSDFIDWLFSSFNL